MMELVGEAVIARPGDGPAVPWARSTPAPAADPTTKPRPATKPRREEQAAPEQPWQCIVWDDPVNLMTYVTHVFMTHFRYSRERAHRLMLQVHEGGSAVVRTGARETIESDVQAMHQYGLWATMAQEGER